MSKRIWYNPEVEYIGATGVNSAEEMATLALEDGEVLNALDVDEGATVSDVVKVLNIHGILPEIVPSSYLRRERWDATQTTACAIDEKPGRGYVKVLGVSL